MPRVPLDNQILGFTKNFIVAQKEIVFTSLHIDLDEIVRGRHL
jgi:hypothetical protein